MGEVPQQNEEWKEIQGWNGYFISNFGTVQRQSRQFNDKMIVINGSVGKDKGYKYVQQMVNGKRINHMVHRLVAKAFIDNPDEKPCIDHIDNDKLNNHFTNLRWCHHHENCKNFKQRVDGKKNGVRFEKGRQRWQADISIDGKLKFLGYFDTYDEAKDAREKAESSTGCKEFYKTGNDENFSNMKARPNKIRKSGEGCIKQRDNGNWRVTFRIKDVKLFDKTFKTFEEANECRINKVEEFKQS